MSAQFHRVVGGGGGCSGSLCRLNTHHDFRISGSYQAASVADLTDLLRASSILAADCVLCMQPHTEMTPRIN